MDGLVFALTLLVAVLLVIGARRYTRRRQSSLEAALNGAAGKWVTVEVLGAGKGEFVVAVHGSVDGVRDGRLYLDSVTPETPPALDGLVRVMTPALRSDDGIGLEYIRAVYGPRHLRLWP